MTFADAVRAARRSAALFRLVDRGAIEVRGADRVRFLQGQLTNDVAALDPAGPRSGCYALALSREGRIAVDLHVLARRESIWLETAASHVAATLERLGKYLIADDVELVDRSGEIARFGVEGPRARELLTAAAARIPELLPDSAAETRIAGAEVLVAAYGWSGEAAFQLFAPRAAEGDVGSALAAAAAACDAVEAGSDALEVLRIEAGIPSVGRELGPDVLPAEARLLARAVSFTKGCYTGQEVVARMQSRGRVAHLLVGLAFEGALPEIGAPLLAGGVRVGAVTSAARSPSAGPIGLAFVRRGHDAPDTALEVGGGIARVVALPFVAGGGQPADRDSR